MNSEWLDTCFRFLETHKDIFFWSAVPGIYLLMFQIGRHLKRRHRVRLNLTYHLFALSVALYFSAKLFDEQLAITAWGKEVAFRHEVGAIMCLLGTLVLMALVDRYVWELYFREKHRVKIPKFLSQVVSLTLIVVSVVLILVYGYHAEIKGLVLAPSVLAVILGLAMQNLLGNIIAGLALQFGKAFKDGDWLLVNNQYGKVVEINWRSTRLLTNDDVSIDIPNLDMTKSVITNLNLPTRLHAARITLMVDNTMPPTRVKDVLLHATSNAKGVSGEKKPKVYLKNFGESAVEYEIKFYLEDHEYYNDICDAIRTNVWYSFQRHGIKMPFPTRTIHLERPARSKEQEIQHSARLMLRQHALFKTLTDDQLDSLLPRGRIVHFGQGENLIQQGAAGDSMFILVSGEADVIVERNGKPTQVANLRSGDCFGEMSLLTGERRSATVAATRDCEVVEIGKAILARSLKENPELLDQLGSLLARRQMETEGIVAASIGEEGMNDTKRLYTSSFMKKLTKFFEL